jgi:hypothetical protein
MTHKTKFGVFKLLSMPLICRMTLEFALGQVADTRINLESIDGAMMVQLDIPRDWPHLSTPIEIVSCTNAAGVECFSRYCLV